MKVLINFKVLILVLGILKSVEGKGTPLLSGWVDAHATFYGGGDASGTMGMYINPS